MREYMVTVHFPGEIDQEFVDLVPGHRALVNQMMSRGTITSYTLASDRQTLWITMIAESDTDVKENLRAMPLHKYMQYQIQELMFHNSPVFAPHRFSLN